MKFIYKITLGFLLFNSILLLFSGFFPTDSEQFNADNITSDAAYDEYKITGEIFSFSALSVSLGVGGIIGFSFGAIVSWFIKSPVPIGAGLFSGFLAGLYVGSISILDSLNVVNNTIITNLIILISIGIGILAFIAIIEMFTGTGGAN